MKYSVKEGNYSVMGTQCEHDTITFTFESERESDCAILLYRKNHAEETIRIEVPSDDCIGSLRSVAITGIPWKRYDYLLEIDGKKKVDPYARKITGREQWADKKRRNPSDELKSGFDFQTFSWEEDQKIEIPKMDMVLYKLHIRGFSMDDPTVRGKKKGTFLALQEKIPYLKSLGVTSVECMPVYEFEEIEFEESEPEGFVPESLQKAQAIEKTEKTQPIKKINYWGYVEGNYFAPKASYAYGASASNELKELILALHKNHMECILEFFFPADMDQNMITEILNYWVKEYHVDGFHLLGNNLPLASLTQSRLLSRTKLFCDHIPDELQTETKGYQNLYEYNDKFLYPIRQMMNRMEGDMRAVTGQIRRQRTTLGYVNYMASNNGMTLADVFSYSEKHNEENGEENEDGTNWNFSNNYGVEGPTRKRYIQQIRRQQMKNALALVFLSQGVPLIFSGDEFGNSQKGNNNAYCQDNKIGWVNWREMEKHQDLLKFVRDLSKFRQTYPVIRKKEPFQFADYEQTGAPDLSYHCKTAWVTGFEANCLAVGIYYCGRQKKKNGESELVKLYIGINFHNGIQELALPQIEKTQAWYQIMDTGQTEPFYEPENLPKMTEKQLRLQGHTICILQAKTDPQAVEKEKKRTHTAKKDRKAARITRRKRR
ncbi:MAG: glycogen operon protein GlgX [Lachnospiraceae bacterium]